MVNGYANFPKPLQEYLGESYLVVGSSYNMSAELISTFEEILMLNKPAYCTLDVLVDALYAKVTIYLNVCEFYINDKLYQHAMYGTTPLGSIMLIKQFGVNDEISYKIEILGV